MSEDWTPEFPGQRPPFTSEELQGNDLAVKHGAYAVVKLGPRVAELADMIRPLVGALYRESDELAVQTLAFTWARIEAAEAALANVEPGSKTTRAASADSGTEKSASRTISRESLEANLRGWVNTQRRLLNDLGLTPAARARLGLDVARTRHVANLSSLPDTDAEADALDEEAEPS